MSDPGFELPASPPPEEEAGAPTWVVTFGDMMSLLLTFFILLFSMSELKMERFLLASQSMREAMGGTAEEVVDDPMGLMPDPVDPDLQLQNPADAEQRTAGPESGQPEATTPLNGNSWVEEFSDAYLQRIAERLADFIDENKLHELIEVVRADEGVYLRIKAVALFPSGVAVVPDEKEWILSVLADVTSEIEIPVVVSGHADNQPIRRGPFASNWELSAARAAGVARALVEHGQDPSSMRVEAWGEHKPIDTNATLEGRGRNRRVELFYSRKDVMEWARSILPRPDDATEEGEGEEVS